MLGSGINLIWCHFYSCLLSNWLFAENFSNCSNSLNFEAKINCNTIKPNVPKWRKTCTGLTYDLLHFYGPQSHILSGDTFEGPCIYVTWVLLQGKYNGYNELLKKNVTQHHTTHQRGAGSLVPLCLRIPECRSFNYIICFCVHIINVISMLFWLQGHLVVKIPSPALRQQSTWSK